MNEVKTDVPFFDAMTIEYECPRCGHMQKQTFKFRKIGDEIKFQCSKCEFGNAITIEEKP